MAATAIENPQFVVSDITFKVHVDPNHCFGSSIKLTNGNRVKTLFNLCSTLIIDVENKWLLPSDPKLDERRGNVDTAKSDKYEAKVQTNAPPRG